MAKQMHVSLAYGSHLPCLIRAMERTIYKGGDVCEIGTGVFSTPFLRYSCMLSGRKLVSYENYREWYDFMLKYWESNVCHEINFVEKYADAPIDRDWDVVLIDQTPDSSRSEEALRLKDKAKYIIVHDSNPSNYKVTHYDKLYPHFKYKTDWLGDKNRATVLSNIVNLEDFWK